MLVTYRIDHYTTDRETYRPPEAETRTYYRTYLTRSEGLFSVSSKTNILPGRTSQLDQVFGQQF